MPEQVIVPWILSQGGDAVPLEPREIVDAVREKALLIVEKTDVKFPNGSN